jgi:predicted AlkP superfamily phosphohydrolase/phosphomutase/tetratricopeptide (TPR) repeat protein
MAKRRVLLVGWDAADWKVIHPLVDAGNMPNLAALIDRGVMGNIATLQPMFSPMLWTSIATGKRPYKHGVHGFSEVAPDTGQVRPISALSRTTKAIWNILHQEGKTCHVVGWWPSHPVEPLRGAMVSNHFQVATGDLGTPWPIAPGTVHPPEVAEALAALRVHPHELEGDMLRAFVPDAPEIDQQTDKRLGTLAKLVAECASVHAASTHILHTRPDWDFAAVYHDAIDHFSHAFMRYHPPRLEWVSEEDFRLYSQVLGGAYVFHDQMLGVLLELAGDDTTVILVSDHGFHPDHLRPRSLPNEPAGPAEEHRPFGIFVAAGPGIREDGLVYGASLVDVAPTILSLYDLPVGRDMDGGPLLSIYEHPPRVRFIDSWDDVPGDAARLSGGEAGGSEAAAAVLKQLADLGYIEAPPEDQQQAIDQTIREQRYNLARALVDGGRDDEAATILADLWDRWPDETRFGIHLFQIRLDCGELVEARETFALLEERKREAMAKAVPEIEALVTRIRQDQGLPEKVGTAPGAAPATDPKAPAEKPSEIDWEQVSEVDKRSVRRLQSRATVNQRAFAFLHGSLLAAEGCFPEALAELDRAAGVQMSQQPSLQLKRGEVLLAMRRPAEALAAFGGVLEIDPVNPLARFGLARAALARRDFPRAAAEAQAAIGCRHNFAPAHMIAGLALWRSGQVRDAEPFLRAAVAISPLHPRGHRLLGRYLANAHGDLAGALEQRRLAENARRQQLEWQAGIRPEKRHRMEIQQALGRLPEAGPRPAFDAPASRCVVVVSGLPRSGTSMMMQMLAAGGFPVLADDQRLADESNPRGYLEFAPAKRLVKDNAWVNDATGKAVKIVSPLVPHLPKGPDGPRYLVVALRRPVAEVVASQRAMLARDGKAGAQVPDDALAAIFERQVITARTFLAHLESQGQARVLDVAYHAALADPRAAAERLAEFLGTGWEGAPFDAAAAAAAVEPALRRHRKGS